MEHAMNVIQTPSLPASIWRHVSPRVRNLNFRRGTIFCLILKVVLGSLNMRAESFHSTSLATIGVCAIASCDAALYQEGIPAVVNSCCNAVRQPMS